MKPKEPLPYTGRLLSFGLCHKNWIPQSGRRTMWDVILWEVTDSIFVTYVVYLEVWLIVHIGHTNVMLGIIGLGPVFGIYLSMI